VTEPSADVDVVIVGAGMAGLTAARELVSAGLRVTVLDKGRSVGGRMATRRIGAARFDHGAQHFSARSDTFSATVDRWITTGIAAVWYQGRSVTQPDRGRESRHVGTNGMRGMPTHLAEGLDVRSAVQVTRVETDGSSAQVSTDRGNLTGRSCIVTAPLPQTMDLLDPVEHSGLFDELDRITYDPCLAVMAELDDPAGLTDGHRALSDGPAAWIADNHHKGISAAPAVTIHSSAEFARRYLEADSSEWMPKLLAAATPHLAGTVVAATAHRWRYSQPRESRDDGSRMLGGPVPIVLAGEVFAGAKVEGAYLSGRSAARTLLGRLI
jgi:predicted NAD/FAD-dependent oxidoreductase